MSARVSQSDERQDTGAVGAPSAPVDLARLSDQELLDGIRASSEAHFNALYRRYFQRIYNYVFSRVGNHAEAEEVVQETFMAVFKSLDSYRGRSSLLSWIYGVARNTANTSRRKAAVRHMWAEKTDPEELRPSPSITDCTPEEHLLMRHYAKQVSGQVECLAGWQAEAFEMRHLHDMSIGEISARTGRSSDSIRSSLYRVKRMLMELAHPDGEMPESEHA